MAHRLRLPLVWKLVLYYGALIALLLILVGVIQPGWLRYLPVGGLEGLPQSAGLADMWSATGQKLASSQPRLY